MLGYVKRLYDYCITGQGRKWLSLYDIEQPLAIALCQGAAMHFQDKVNGVKDFDAWFFYPFNEKHLPYRKPFSLGWDIKIQNLGVIHQYRVILEEKLMC